MLARTLACMHACLPARLLACARGLRARLAREACARDLRARLAREACAHRHAGVAADACEDVAIAGLDELSPPIEALLRVDAVAEHRGAARDARTRGTDVAADRVHHPHRPWHRSHALAASLAAPLCAWKVLALAAAARCAGGGSLTTRRCLGGDGGGGGLAGLQRGREALKGALGAVRGPRLGGVRLE